LVGKPTLSELVNPMSFFAQMLRFNFYTKDSNFLIKSTGRKITEEAPYAEKSKGQKKSEKNCFPKTCKKIS